MGSHDHSNIHADIANNESSGKPSLSTDRGKLQLPPPPAQSNSAPPAVATPSPQQQLGVGAELRHMADETTSQSPAVGLRREIETDESHFSPPGFGVAQLRNGAAKSHNNAHGNVTPLSANSLPSPLRTPSAGPHSSSMSDESKLNPVAADDRSKINYFYHAYKNKNPNMYSNPEGSATNSSSARRIDHSYTSSAEEFTSGRTPVRTHAPFPGRTDERFGSRYNSVQRQTIQRLLRIVREVKH